MAVPAASAEETPAKKAGERAREKAESSGPEEPAVQADSPAAPLYVPRRRGAPRARVPAATRSAATPGATPLAPVEVGLTLRAQPVLYWHLGEAGAARVEFTLSDDQSPEPLLETTLPAAAGLNRIRLADHGVELETGRRYRWFVAPGGNASAAGAGIERIEPSAELRATLANAPAGRRPLLLAQEGIWYDAIDEVSRAADAEPTRRDAVAWRASLLEQVGLGEVARELRE